MDPKKNKSQENTSNDSIAGALLFAKTLSLIIPSGEGIIVKADGESSEYFGKNEPLMLIANIESQIQVAPLKSILGEDGEFEEGMWVTLANDDKKSEETNE